MQTKKLLLSAFLIFATFIVLKPIYHEYIFHDIFYNIHDDIYEAKLTEFDISLITFFLLVEFSRSFIFAFLYPLFKHPAGPNWRKGVTLGIFFGLLSGLPWLLLKEINNVPNDLWVYFDFMYFILQGILAGLITSIIYKE
jgi:hypothetical protein